MKRPSFVLLICGAAMAMCLSVHAQATRASGGGCLVAQFKAMALTQNDPGLRTQQAQDWMQANMARCSPEQLSAIKSNSAAWLGTALTPALWGLIEGAIEARIAGNPALMGQLYESLGKEGVASVDTYRNPAPRAPVVRPMEIHGGLAGAVNYGSISGPSTAIVNQNSHQNQNMNQNAVQSPNTSLVNPGGMSNNQNAVQLQGQSGRITSR